METQQSQPQPEVGALVPVPDFTPIYERFDKLISVAQGMKYAMVGLAAAFAIHSIVLIATRPSSDRR